MLALAGLVVVMCVCCIGSISTSGATLDQGSGRQVGQDLLTGVTLQGAASTPTETVSMFGLILQSFLRNLLNLIFVLAVGIIVIFFPKEDFVQWAARKQFLRKIFDFKDVRLGAQTKYLKIDKLI